MRTKPSGQVGFAIAATFVLMILLAFPFPACSQLNETTGDDKIIELLRADYTEFDQDFLDAERVVGNVRFKHGTATMDCDSAWFYRNENRIKAYGNIYIRQQDTLNLWGDYLEYDGDLQRAEVTGKVRLKDQQMSLETSHLEYDLQNKTAHYPNWGNIRNGNDRLRSRKGTYYSRSRTFFFKDSVRLVNPDYVMRSDTLHYNTFTETTHFYGTTTITGKDNVITCRNGWYDTRRNMAEFSRGARIEGKHNTLLADSMLYNRNNGVGQAFGNIILTDTIEDIRIQGQFGKYFEKEKELWITGSPLGVKYTDGDSLMIRADTLRDVTDTSGLRSLRAYRGARLFKSDLQGICDSLSYGFSDSSIHMYRNPVLWSNRDQISGDTIFIERKSGTFNLMRVRHDAFITSPEKPGHFNQIGGRNMIARFSGGKLNQVDVSGNGRSLYYAREADSTYTGVNYIECSSMLIEMDSNQVSNIRFYSSPSGTFYPVNELPAEKQLISGFVWLIDKKPELGEFVEKPAAEELPVEKLPSGGGGLKN